MNLISKPRRAREYGNFSSNWEQSHFCAPPILHGAQKCSRDSALEQQVRESKNCCRHNCTLLTSACRNENRTNTRRAARTTTVPNFALRISDFFRPSDFGFRICAAMTIGVPKEIKGQE